MISTMNFIFFFFNDTPTTDIYTLSLHDALPISYDIALPAYSRTGRHTLNLLAGDAVIGRSEEHTSELQSRLHLVCRLLLEKKKTTHLNLPLTRTHDVPTPVPCPFEPSKAIAALT